MRKCFVLAILLWVPRVAAASPITVNLLQQTYTTTLTTQVIAPAPYTTTTQALTSDSDAITDTMSLIDGVSATASSGPWAIDLYTQAFPTNFSAEDGTIQAGATSAIDFTPTVTGIADLSLVFATDYRGLFFTHTAASLRDVTTDTILWGYGWLDTQVTAVTFNEWIGVVGGPQVATLSLPTLLDASHVYTFSMYAATSADKDHEQFSVTLNGIHAVPEPATLALWIVAAAVSIRRRVIH